MNPLGNLSGNVAGSIPGNAGMPNMPGQGMAPHDIEGLILYSRPWWHYGLMVLAVLLVLAALYALWRVMKRPPAQAQVTKVNPWQELESKARALDPDQMLGRGGEKELFYQLSLCLRSGIELSTLNPNSTIAFPEIRATDMTFRELAPLIKAKLKVPENDRQGMLTFLQTSDLVKFADQKTSIEEARAAKAQLLTWLPQLKQLAYSLLTTEAATLTQGLPSEQKSLAEQRSSQNRGREVVS